LRDQGRNQSAGKGGFARAKPAMQGDNIPSLKQGRKLLSKRCGGIK
jgi:hypothetical protein